MNALPETSVLVDEIIRMLTDPQAIPESEDRLTWTNYLYHDVLSMHIARLFRPDAPGSKVSPYCKKSKDKNCSEYLVDFCLAEELPISEEELPLNYRRLLLAVECEWIPRLNELLYDFGKLADIRAERKIFIGQLGSANWRKWSDVVRIMGIFWNQHKLVLENEEVGVILFSRAGWSVEKKIICKSDEAGLRYMENRK